MVAITTDSHWDFDIPPGHNIFAELRECILQYACLHEAYTDALVASRAAYQMGHGEDSYQQQSNRRMRDYYRSQQAALIADLSQEAYALLVGAPYVVVDDLVACFSPLESDGSRDGQMVLTRSLVL